MNQLGDVAVLAQHLVQADRDVEEAEQAFKRAKENARRLREEALPGAMQELQLTKLRLEDGTEITIADEVYCSISEDHQADAHEWLDKNGFGGLIKTEVIVPFGRGSDAELAELKALLQGHEYAFFVKTAVHPMTLKAWLKEQLRDGDPKQVPLQLFGARPVTVAKVKLPKGN